MSRLIGLFSMVGVLVGLLFFCASLAPSLLPRLPIVQGVQSGLVFVVGYGAGRFGLSVWRFMELRELRGDARRILSLFLLVMAVGLAIFTLNRMLIWQNSIRDLMEMPLVESAYPVTVVAIAFATATILLFIALGLIWVGDKVITQMNRVFPRRISITLGTALLTLAVFSTVNGLVVTSALTSMDELFGKLDQVVDDGVHEPAGFETSLIAWDDIGRNGKLFLTRGPGRTEIAEMTGRAAMDPVRVYAGYNTKDTFEERADIAVQELIRSGGFERSVLIVATVTGTGWLDPAAMDPVAFLHGGDLSIISMQYSYLPSWLTLMIDPNRSRRAAAALFNAVYAHWTTLSPDQRPRMYLFGLSLGALGSEASSDLLTLMADPIQGAFWVGPPFASNRWAGLTAARNPDSPQWLPEYGDGSIVRFMTQNGFSVPSDTKWGPLRIVYLQHGSDPMSFFSSNLAFHSPDWLGKSRAPDVSPYFQWYPVVSFVNVGFDVPMATTVPPGFGHTFTPDKYIDGWIAVTDPANWSPADTERLKAHFADFVSSPI
jgi:uncharacterized membrane protein